ncbi:malto-oligosyltrehalose trehalohydrolase [Acuticoccus sp. MNP-M23]|uniref:malto-oligosyltrehalose trehalohydrolase n=1 Tax=Acuticoccus sp. MNP-M23 TaxID=3072793 RepID=UPI002816928C|nr:malto-oligosyltrehalose trehalohydrolase [Acuticoccus sp. MNP-M23]WMS40800.1 malto-oligosyltrehalose trehalohydrolase [Acuticoccus sp. MNP-M23]
MSQAHIFQTTWGATLTDGGARFRLWAPDDDRLILRADAGDFEMERQDGGWFELVTDAVPVGGAYAFVLPDGSVVPDPAARAQMGDVHGPSKLVDPGAYTWRNTSWQGRPWEETVIYEMHIGTFTPGGTFRSAIEKLPHLADLGVTAVEVLPVAQFGGARGWGYDGVLLYAPHNTYGTPDDFKAFVDAAHDLGLMVFLDVVYNHFGPDGNYLGKYASKFFDPERHTPWGAAIAYGEGAVRDFFLENPLTWLTEYNLDGLRFDAIDHVRDDTSDEPLLMAMARRVRETFDRPVHLHTEDERNIIALHPYENGKPQRFTAEWNDDYHNVIHPIATGDNEGYYIDFVEDHWKKLARALAEGFIFQGEPSRMHGNEPRGVPSTGQPLTAFVIFNQNHDQVGNRAFGERLIDMAEHDVVLVLTATLLLGPQIPLLWMGEEWGETNPFCFFCDFHGELADAVRKGRRNEFSKFDAFIDPDTRNDIPDPNAKSTFDASRIDWGKLATPHGEGWHSIYKHLLGVRAAEIAPRLAGIGPNAGKIVQAEDGVIEVNWRLGDGSTLAMAINLTADDKGAGPDGRLLAAVARGSLSDNNHLAAHSCVVTLVNG